MTKIECNYLPEGWEAYSDGDEYLFIHVGHSEAFRIRNTVELFVPYSGEPKEYPLIEHVTFI